MLPKRLKSSVIFLVFLCGLPIVLFSQSQTLTLEEAIEAAMKKNPANFQFQLIEKASEKQIEIYGKQNLPTVTWNTQASLQSENIDLEFPIPNVEPISLPLYKAQSAIESNYLVYDGGISKTMITSEKVKRNLNEQNLNIQLYGIKNQVVELYYSIILLNRQNEILDSSIAFLNIRKKSLESMVRNGVILNSDLDKMELEILKIEQNQAGLKSKRNVLVSALSNLTGINISGIRLKPSDNISDVNLIWNDRPEIKMFSLRNELLDANSRLIDLKNKPKLALFLKAGLGYPNPFNFFDNSFSPFAIGGVNFTWNIWDWKRTDLDKQKFLIEKDLIENQKNIFDENMKLEADKLVTEISGLENNAEFDNKIIGRQKSIIEVTENQYKNGVVSINVYLEEINKKSIAELNAIIHQIEIQKAKYKLRVLLNK